MILKIIRRAIIHTVGEQRIKAAALAAYEYDLAMSNPDWEERRDIVRALDVLDQSDHPDAEQAFYLFQYLLAEHDKKVGL